VYALRLDDPGWRDLSGCGVVLSPGPEGLAYVSVGAGKGGLRRRFREEWAPANSGRASPRRTLGGLLRLPPRPIDRSHWGFTEAGEVRLTEWIHAHGAFACWEGSIADELERRLIDEPKSPINLTHWANPAREAIRALRPGVR